MNFQNLLGKQVFKNHNCNPFQSSRNLSTCSSFYICCVIYTFSSCFEQFNLCFTQFDGGPYCLNLLNFVAQLLQGSYPMKGKSYHYFRSEEDHLYTQIPFLWTIWLLDHQLKWKSGFHLFLLQHPVLGPPSGPARRVMSVYLGFHYNERLHTINDWLLQILSTYTSISLYWAFSRCPDGEAWAKNRANKKHTQKRDWGNGERPPVVNRNMENKETLISTNKILVYNISELLMTFKKQALFVMML